MRLRMLRSMAALALAAASLAAGAQTAPAQAAEAGRRLYVNSCTRCHGINLVTNGIGFDLRSFPQGDKQRFIHSVTNGKGAMPAWGATLKPEQIELLWAYIGSVNGWPLAASAPQ